MTVSERWRDRVAAGVALGGLVVLAFALAALYGSPAWGFDYAAYHGAAQRLVETGTPYQAETLAGPYQPGPFGLYLYSPLPALVLVPLTALAQDAATLVWLAARLALLVATCALMPVPLRARLVILGVACVSAPLLRDLVLGNVSLIVTLVAVIGWRFLDRPAGAAAIAASLAVRPPMGLFLGWWLLRGRWQPLAAALLAIAVVVAVSLPFVGVAGWLDYAIVLRNLAGFEEVARNLAVGEMVRLLGGPAWMVAPAQLAGYAIAIAAVLLSLRRDRELSYVVVLGATLILSPLLWEHYLTHLLVPAAFLMSRGQWWGTALPLLGWLPEGVLSIVAIAGLLLPFVARDRGEPAGSLLDRPVRRRASAPA